jgi:hypothetical protein
MAAVFNGKQLARNCTPATELFAYFIVDPETDRAIRDRIDQKLKDVGRKPIKGLPEAGGEESEQH